MLIHKFQDWKPGTTLQTHVLYPDEIEEHELNLINKIKEDILLMYPSAVTLSVDISVEFHSAPTFESLGIKREKTNELP